MMHVLRSLALFVLGVLLSGPSSAVNANEDGWPAVEIGKSVEIQGTVNFPAPLRKKIKSMKSMERWLEWEPKEWAVIYATIYRPLTPDNPENKNWFVQVSTGSEVGTTRFFGFENGQLKLLNFAEAVVDEQRTTITRFGSESEFPRASVDAVTGRIVTGEITHTCDGECLELRHIFELNANGDSYYLVGVDVYHEDHFMRNLWGRSTKK